MFLKLSNIWVYFQGKNFYVKTRVFLKDIKKSVFYGQYDISIVFQAKFTSEKIPSKIDLCNGHYNI